MEPKKRARILRTMARYAEGYSIEVEVKKGNEILEGELGFRNKLESCFHPGMGDKLLFRKEFEAHEPSLDRERSKPKDPFLADFLDKCLATSLYSEWYREKYGWWDDSQRNE